jgi:ribonuclease VapC
MVIDSSAVLAILLQEPEAELMAAAISDDAVRLMSTVSLLETAIVIEVRKGPPGGRELDLMLHRARIEIVSFNSEQAEIARDAWLRFGRSRHPAALDMGDCCSYALSRSSGEPLLFKGTDFARTDVLQIPATQPRNSDGVS